jgi:hypothetical protein
LVSRRHSPEVKAIAQGDSTKDLLDYLEKTQARTVHLFFRRGKEPKHGIEERAPGFDRREYGVHEKNSAYITFYSPRAGAPPKAAPNHFRFPLTRHRSLFQEIVAILRLVEAELTDHHVVVYIGWPLSSWLDRLAIGVWFLNLERLPRMFPEFGFIIRYTTRVPLPSPQVNPEETTVAKPQKKTDQP